MKPIAYHTLAMVLALGVGVAAGQGADGAGKIESFMGVVKAVSGSSVTVERGTLSGSFTVDSKTHVGARGATAATQANQAAGRNGFSVSDAVHIGDQVMVRFRDTRGTMMATDIQVRTQAAQPTSR